MTIKSNEPAVRVLVVEGDGLGQGTVEGILGTTAAGKAVHAASVTQARELWRGGGFDLVVAAETRFRDVLDGIFAFVGLFSTDGIVLDTNQAPLVAGGLLRGDVVGHRFVDLPWFSHSEIERARVSEAIGRAARGEASRFETTVVSVKNGIVHIDAAFAPLPGPDGAITRVVGTGVDVTVRRKAENDLRRSQELLAEVAARWRGWAAGNGTSPRNQVTWSEELFRIYALDPARHVPSYESFLATVHPDDREHTSTVLRLARENVSTFVYDHRIIRPDGSVRMLHTRGEVVPGPLTAASRAWWGAAGTSPIAGRRSAARRRPGRTPKQRAGRWRTSWGASPTASSPSTETADIATSTRARGGSWGGTRIR